MSAGERAGRGEGAGASSVAHTRCPREMHMSRGPTAAGAPASVPMCVSVAMSHSAIPGTLTHGDEADRLNGRGRSRSARRAPLWLPHGSRRGGGGACVYFVGPLLMPPGVLGLSVTVPVHRVPRTRVPVL